MFLKKLFKKKSKKRKLLENKKGDYDMNQSLNKVNSSSFNKCVLVTGNIALTEGHKFGLYLCAADDIRYPCDYISFYYHKKIWGIYRIDSSIIIDFKGDIPTIEELKKSYLEIGSLDAEELYNKLKSLKSSGIHRWSFSSKWKIISFNKDKNLIDFEILHSKKGAFIQRQSYVWADSIINLNPDEDDTDNIRFVNKD
jgi:hypothetical protein